MKSISYLVGTEQSVYSHGEIDQAKKAGPILGYCLVLFSTAFFKQHHSPRYLVSDLSIQCYYINVCHCVNYSCYGLYVLQPQILHSMPGQLHFVFRHVLQAIRPRLITVLESVIICNAFPVGHSAIILASFILKPFGYIIGLFNIPNRKKNLAQS